MAKAQIQMFESIFVILIFFVFIGVGLIFFFNASKQNIQHKAAQFQTMEAIKVALVALNLPELVCTSGEYIRSTCFDMQKVQGFTGLVGLSPEYQYNYYFNLFGYSKITVSEIYPSEGIWVVYDRPKSGWTRKQSFMVPIGLEDNLERTVKLGVLRVEVYE